MSEKESTSESQINVQGYNIVTILKRLEAATSRLEDVTIFQEEAHKKAVNAGSFKGPVTDTPTAVPSTTNVAQTTPVPAPASEAPEKPKDVVAFEQFLKNEVDPFVALSNQLDPLIGQVAETFAAAFAAQAGFLEITSKAKKTNMEDPNFLKILAPINEKIAKIMEIKEANRTSQFSNHLNTISEGAPVLGWVVTETPVSFIPEFKDSARFWSDRVLKEYKGKDAKYVEWTKEFGKIFDALKAYVKEFHPKGPTWNAQGKPLREVLKDAEALTTKDVPPAPPAPSAGGPPPPPPPPPANLFDEPAKSEGGMNAVFQDLNKGEGITSSLKKVDKSQMTHKNPALREQAPVAGAKKPSPPKKPTSLSTIKKKPARKELVDGTKWIIENFTEADVSGPIVIEAEMHQSVFIGGTSGITVQIKGKANAVSLSETKNTGVVVDNLISGVDVIKSFKFGLQVVGLVPMISVDKSDEGAIYLSQQSIDANTQVFTSSTTTLNINVPTADDDYTELSVPEQFSHSVKNGKLVSEVVEHIG